MARIDHDWSVTKGLKTIAMVFGRPPIPLPLGGNGFYEQRASDRSREVGMTVTAAALVLQITPRSVFFVRAQLLSITYLN